MKRILIVDGDHVRRLYLLAELESRYEVHVCTRGDQAVQLIEEIQPDALIINLSLPYLDGFIVLQQLKYRPPAILALASIISNRIIENAAALGIQDVLLSSCSIKSIISHLEVLLFARA